MSKHRRNTHFFILAIAFPIWLTGCGGDVSQSLDDVQDPSKALTNRSTPASQKEAKLETQAGIKRLAEIKAKRLADAAAAKQQALEAVTPAPAPQQ